MTEQVLKAKNLTLAATLSLIIIVGMLNFLLPAFEAVHAKSTQELSLLTKVVFDSYDFWWVFPITSLVFFIAVQSNLQQKPSIVKISVKVAKLSFACALMLIIITIAGLYLAANP